MASTTSNANLIDDPRISAYGRVLEAQRWLHRTFDRSLREKAGISVVWYEALLRVARSEGGHIPINELGEAMVLTSGGATRLVDRLEEGGYLERIACPTDRRVSWAHITEKGLAVLAAATEVHLHDLDEYFVSRLDPDEMAALEASLRKVRPRDS